MCRLPGNLPARELPCDFLKLAMDTSLVTLQAENEVVNIKLNDDFKDDHLYTIRQKTSGDSDMAFIKIKVDQEIMELRNRSVAMLKQGGYLLPYLIHRLATTKNKKQLANKPHPTYVMPKYLSKAFTKVRDATGYYDNLPEGSTPTSFHEIRGLGSRVLKEQGWTKEQIRGLMTHTDEKTTDIYLTSGRQALKPEHYISVETGIRLDNLPDI